VGVHRIKLYLKVEKKYLIVVVGPTAVGKTALGISLAQHFKTEIISADSRQIYRQMEVGTAKPTVAERVSAVHHFVDILDLEEDYNAGRFADEALKLLDDLFAKNRVVMAVGGSGLYVKALCEGIDPMPSVPPLIREQLNQELKEEGLGPLVKELEHSDPAYFSEVDSGNPQRVIRALEVIRATGKPYTSFRVRKPVERPFEVVKIGLEMPRELLYAKINDRMDQMIKKGLFKEAEALFPLKDYNALQTVGYSEIFRYLEGAYDQEEAVRLLKRNSRRYAKRQLTWFKKDDKTQWFLPGQLSEIIQYLAGKLDV